MVFNGLELADLLSRREIPIELRNEYGRCCRILTVNEAQALDVDLVVGVGNQRRLRFLRFRTRKYDLQAGSRTTSRITNESRKYYTSPMIREHRPCRGISS